MGCLHSLLSAYCLYLSKWCNLRLQVSQHNLVHHGDWYSCQFDVLETAFVLDFVFSDTAKRSWDNNAQQVIKYAAASAILQWAGTCCAKLL